MATNSNSPERLIATSSKSRERLVATSSNFATSGGENARAHGRSFYVGGLPRVVQIAENVRAHGRAALYLQVLDVATARSRTHLLATKSN